MFKYFSFSSLAVLAACEQLSRQCLSITDATGSASGDPISFSTYGEDAEFMPLYDSGVRISEITVCTETNGGSLKGLSFKMSSGD